MRTTDRRHCLYDSWKVHQSFQLRDRVVIAPRLMTFVFVTVDLGCFVTQLFGSAAPGFGRPSRDRTWENVDHRRLDNTACSLVSLPDPDPGFRPASEE